MSKPPAAVQHLSPALRFTPGTAAPGASVDVADVGTDQNSTTTVTSTTSTVVLSINRPHRQGQIT